ncbi:MAG: hypothetical protein R3E39_17580 [Anaerolineae bacterium]
MKRTLFVVLALALLVALTAPTLAQDKKVVTVSYTQEPSSLNVLYTSQWFAFNVVDLLLTPPWFIDGDLECRAGR